MDKASKAVRDSRKYRERAQPKERRKWGLLEKHKDYALRARSHAAKQATLKALRAKAAERNPDEFYFGMINRTGPSARGRNATGTVSGRQVGEGTIGIDAMRLYKTQDMGYIRSTRNVMGKEVQALEQKLQAMQGGAGQKVVFVDGPETAAVSTVPHEESLDADEIEDDEQDKLARNRRNMLTRQRDRCESRLSTAKERLRALTEAEDALDLQRAKMGKSPTVGGVNKDGKKFRIRQRKR